MSTLTIVDTVLLRFTACKTRSRLYFRLDYRIFFFLSPNLSAFFVNYCLINGNYWFLSYILPSECVRKIETYCYKKIILCVKGYRWVPAGHICPTQYFKNLSSCTFFDVLYSLRGSISAVCINLIRIHKVKSLSVSKD